jgi:hypothetical protein
VPIGVSIEICHLPATLMIELPLREGGRIP